MQERGQNRSRDPVMPSSRRTLSEPSESKGCPCWVYIIECAGGMLYTGVTQDVARRFAEHQCGGSRFTKAHPAQRLRYTEAFASRSDAERRERQIKGWTRAKKLALAAGNLAKLKHL
jgi:putative endonuclease